MMRFELGLECPDPKRAPISAVTIGGSYVIGGLIPLVPYIFTKDAGPSWKRPCGSIPPSPRSAECPNGRTIWDLMRSAPGP